MRPGIPVLSVCLALAACAGEPTQPLPYGVMTKEPGLLGVITAQSGVEVMPPAGAGGGLAASLAEASNRRATSSVAVLDDWRSEPTFLLNRAPAGHGRCAGSVKCA